MATVSERLTIIDKRIGKLSSTREALLKDQAQAEQRKESSIEALVELGMDEKSIRGMSLDQIQSLIDDTQDKIDADMEKLEKLLTEAEEILDENEA